VPPPRGARRAHANGNGVHEYPTDEDKIRLAIDLARDNVLRQTGGPFGAAIFAASGAEPIAVGTNAVLPLRNSIAHAETVAITAAHEALGSERLDAHELFVSAEPCAMCLGAVLASGLERLVFAALREDVERIGFDEGPVFAASYEYFVERGVTVVRGLLRDEGAAVLELYVEGGGPIY
jgi:tRNA(Arg) A34 adenosine deaminase TadA